jgi:hypothetical protein
MTKYVLVASVMSALLGLNASVIKVQTAKDGCALLQLAEVQTLAGVPVGAGKAEKDDTLGSRGCSYEWGAGGNVQSGKSFLTISATSMAKVMPGVDPKTAQQGLLANSKPGSSNTAVIPGVGDAAVYDSNAEIRVTTTAFAKGMMITVSLETKNARAKKDQVITLLKAAVGRL